MPSSARPRAVHRVPGQARHPDGGAILHPVHGHHAARVAHSHQRGHRQVPEEQHGTGPERHLQEGVQLVLHRNVHMRTAACAGRAQLVPDQRGQPEPPEPDSAHVPGKPVALQWPTRGLVRRWACTVSPVVVVHARQSVKHDRSQYDDCGFTFLTTRLSNYRTF